MSLVRSQLVSLEFLIDIKSFRSHYGSGIDTASNRNEYQGHFLGVKSGRCVRLTTYHHPVPLSRNLGALTFWNPLGLSRPVMGLLYLFLFHKNNNIKDPVVRKSSSIRVYNAMALPVLPFGNDIWNLREKG